MADNSSWQAAANSSNTKTLLIVEDDKDIGDFLIRALTEETPYQTLRVTDGAQALEAVKTVKPSLFLLDYQLPGFNGLELYDRLHAIKELQSVPAILLSAAIPPEEEMRKRQITYVKKPFDLNDLLRVIQTALS